jgi:hypothetical protein
MLAPAQEQWLQRLTRLYTVMLLAYPAHFRREYGHEMVVFFRTHVRREMREGSTWRLVQFLVRVTLDWVVTVGQGRISLSHACRWLLALPLAMVAGVVAQRAVTLTWLALVPGWDYAWAWTSLAFFVMSSAFVAVGVAVSPARKDAVARIALGVVMAGSAGFIVLGAWHVAATPVAWGLAIALGGLTSFLSWRRARPSCP